MLLKKEPFVECETPWEGDQLNRKEVADYLTPIIASIKQPFVISLNSPYGTGKSFFIQHWKADLEDKGFKTVYFNAWETDFSDDALIAFISSIKEQLDKKISKKMIQLAKAGGAYLSRKALPVVAKGVARKVIGNETVNELIDLSSQTDEELVNLLGGVAEDSLKKHEAIKASVSSFRKYLETLVKEVTKEQEDEEKKKIVIFVDELDRCKPTYAIEVLECIKHLFNVKGVVFILAIDEEQLRNSVSSIYGGNINGEGYLRKFIDWQLNLPKPSSIKYSHYLFNKFGLSEAPRLIKGRDAFRGADDVIKSIGTFSECLGLTLRQQAQCYTEVNLVIRSWPPTVMPLVFILGAVATMKIVMPTRIKAYCLGHSSAEELLKELEPYMKDKLSLTLYRSWNDFKPWFHAWFLSDDSSQTLIRERQTVQEEINAISASGKVNDRRQPLADRYEYLGQVLGTYSSLRAICRASCSYAECVYRDLERAAYLTDD